MDFEHAVGAGLVIALRQRWERLPGRQALPLQVVVHGEDGQIQDEFTYQDDPFPPRG